MSAPETTGVVPASVHITGPGEESEPGLPPMRTPDDKLFAPEPYITVPVFEGFPSDKLTITFSGALRFDATDKEGQELFHRLQLGQGVELRASGVVVSKSARYVVNAEGDETVTGVAGVKIDSVYLPTAEEL